MCEWVSIWVRGWVSEWVTQQAYAGIVTKFEWVIERVTEWVIGRVNEWVCESSSEELVIL